MLPRVALRLQNVSLTSPTSCFNMACLPLPWRHYLTLTMSDGHLRRPAQTHCIRFQFSHADTYLCRLKSTHPLRPNGIKAGTRRERSTDFAAMMEGGVCQERLFRGTTRPAHHVDHVAVPRALHKRLGPQYHLKTKPPTRI